jgi:hypothetical protein
MIYKKCSFCGDFIPQTNDFYVIKIDRVRADWTDFNDDYYNVLDKVCCYKCYNSGYFTSGLIKGSKR